MEMNVTHSSDSLEREVINRPVDISSVWTFAGTNNSGLTSVNKHAGRSAMSPVVPTTFSWPSSVTTARSQYCHKRSSNDVIDYDGLPAKQYISEERVAGQFNQMSISSPPSVSETEKSADYQEMWDKFHQLEEKLDANISDTEVDEGVCMADSSEERGPQKLLISDKLQSTLSDSYLPHILVPKPSCREVMLWKAPESLIPVAETKFPSPSTTARKKKQALRNLKQSNCLLVPTLRPETPPPSTLAAPVSADVSVHFVEDSEEKMDLNV